MSTAASSKRVTTASRFSIISAELDEVLALGDRIAVMFRGRIMGIVEPSTGREQLGLMMAGIADTSPAQDSTGELGEESAPS